MVDKVGFCMIFIFVEVGGYGFWLGLFFEVGVGWIMDVLI